MPYEEKNAADATRRRTPLMLLLGCLAGLLNGMLGAGSGVVLIWTVNRLFPPRGPEDEKDNFALSLGAVFFITITSYFFYVWRGTADPAAARSLILPAAIGGFAGALLLERISITFLRLLFAGILIWSGFSMLR